MQIWLGDFYSALVGPVYAFWFSYASILLLVVFASCLAHFLAQRYLVVVVRRLLGRANKNSIKECLHQRLFHKTAHLVPAIIIYLSASHLYFEQLGWTKWFSHGLSTVSLLYILFTVIIVLSSLLNIAEAIYATRPSAKKHSIRSYVQVLKLIAWFITIIIAIAILIGKSPMFLLTGLGAAAAILMLVFKDTIMSLVASIQISIYDMVRVGDWLVVKQYGADGDVIEMSLNTIKVQNFDKTITTFPTAAVMTTGVTNWRGMSEAGGRRIKRAIHLDISSICFCNQALLDKIATLDIMCPVLERKMAEIHKYNQDKKISTTQMANGRQLTNVGLFRHYIEAYIRQREDIHQKFTFLIRQLASDANGLPLEIYIFTNTTNWVEYEGIQSDIFDHIFAVLDYFDLKIFQNITT